MLSEERYVLSFDLGVSNGVALGKFSNTEPYSLVDAWQFSGGAVGLKKWLNYDFNQSRGLHDWFRSVPGWKPVGLEQLTVVAEKFTPRPGKGFSLTMGAVEPLRGEGVLVALDVMPDYSPGEKRWQQPHMMYFCGGKTLAERKKRSRAFLKATGNYQLPKQLGAPDSNDAMSATLHGMAYVMKELENEATFRMVTEWSDRMSGNNLEGVK